MAPRLAKGVPALYRIAAALVAVPATAGGDAVRRAAMALATLAVVAALPGPAWASEALARQRNCLNCHGMDRKIVGPGFKQVAERYAGNKGAPAYLAAKIVQGGAGAWGPVAMAANPHVSKDEAARLAVWVLSLK